MTTPPVERTARPTRAGRRRAATALVVATALVAAACGSGPDTGPSADPPAQAQFINETTADGPPVTGGQVVYGVPAETSSFNPVLSSWGPYSMTIGRAIYDTLASYDDEGQVQPFLAESFEPSGDFRSWTVTLRDGIRYHNGKPVTAESVVAFQRALKASPVLNEAFGAIADWEVTGPRTFVMHAAIPWTQYPNAMATQVGVVVDPDWLTSPDILHPVGTGPFIVDRWDVNREMVLKRNPDYWRTDEQGTRLPYLDQVTFKVIVDETARVEALRHGELDIMMQTYATPQVAEMLDEARAGRIQGFSDKRFETPEDYIVLNTARPPFDDVDARRAVAHALDLDDYVAAVTGGLDEPADSPWAPGSKWYAPTDYPRYDPAEAERLVNEVKARNGGRFAFTLLGNPSEESVRMQQWIQQQLTAVGMEVTLDHQLQQTKIIKLIQGDYQAGVSQQFDDVTPGPSVVFWQAWGKPLGTLSLNFSRLNDHEIATLIGEALATSGEASREKYAAISRRLAEVVPYVWLAHASRTVIASPRLVGVVRDVLPEGRPMLEFMQGSHSLARVWLKR